MRNGNKSILVVDDISENIEVLISVLRGDCRVMASTDAEAAIAAARVVRVQTRSCWMS